MPKTMSIAENKLLVAVRGIHADAHVAYAYAIAAETVYRAFHPDDDRPGDGFYEWSDKLTKCGDDIWDIWEKSDGIDSASRQAMGALRDDVDKLIGKL